MALVSCLAGDDGAPLDLVPEPWRSEAREARERLLAQDRPRRAAALARESVECFGAARSVEDGPQPRRTLPRGLAIALGPRERAPRTELPPWVKRAMGSISSLGLLSLARAASASGPSAKAELARRLGPDGARALIETRRLPHDPALLERSSLLCALAMNAPRAADAPRRVGLFRLAWALTSDPGALAATTDALAEGDSSIFEEAAALLFFLGVERSAEERESIVSDMERPT